MWGDIAIAFLLAFITAYVITPYTIRFANKIGALDIPKDQRKIHKSPMPRLRWISCYCRLFSFNNLLTNSDVCRKQYKSLWYR